MKWMNKGQAKTRKKKLTLRLNKNSQNEVEED